MLQRNLYRKKKSSTTPTKLPIQQTSTSSPSQLREYEEKQIQMARIGRGWSVLESQRTMTMARAAQTLHCLNQWRCHSERSFHARTSRTTTCKGGGSDVAVSVKLLEKARTAKVLVLGGTGRIGGSTAIALSRISPSLRLVIAGRNRLEDENWFGWLKTGYDGD